MSKTNGLGSAAPPAEDDFEGFGPEKSSMEFSALPPRVHRLLPKALRDIVGLLEKPHEKDQFVLAALCALAASFPRVKLKYGKQWHFPNLFIAILAPAAAGKGAMQLGGRLADVLDKELRRRTEEQMAEWLAKYRDAASEAEETVLELEKPHYQRVFIAADTTAARLNMSVVQTRHGLIFETEGKSLGEAMQKEHGGGIRPVLLKGAMNERVDVDRAGAEPLYIADPAPSLCVSGTPGSFRGIVEDTEDGLYSRFLFYYFETPPVWRSMFETEADSEVEDMVVALARRLPEAYEALSRRPVPLFAVMPPEGQDVLNAFGHHAMSVVRKGSDLNLQANVKRAVLNAFRISVLLTVLEALERGEDLGEMETIQVNVDYVWCARYLTSALLEHAFRLSENLQEGNGVVQDMKAHFHRALPTGTFTYQEAVEIGKKLEVNGRRMRIEPRTVRKYLHYFVNETGQLSHEHNAYHKEPEPERHYVTLRDSGLLDEGEEES